MYDKVIPPQEVLDVLKITSINDFLDKDTSWQNYYHIAPLGTYLRSRGIAFQIANTIKAKSQELTISLFDKETLLFELYKNAYEHGTARKNGLITSIFLKKDKGIIVGCNDGGDYFTSEDIKQQWESNAKISKQNFGLGQRVIRGISSTINTGSYARVDTSTGTIYHIQKTRTH